MSTTHTQQYLICPITLQLFIDPVSASDGNTYERDAITQWIKQHGTSPITKEALELNQLVAHETTKTAVQNLNQQNTRSSEDLDVLCLYCACPQKLNNIREHKLHCASKRSSIERFEIAEDGLAFATSPKNANFRTGKVVSFENPLPDRVTSATHMNNPSSVTDLDTNTDATKGRRLLFTKRRLQCLLPILFVILFAGITVTLIIYFRASETKVTRPVTTTTYKVSSTTSTTWTLPSSTTSVSTSSLTSTLSSTLSSTFTTTSVSETLCASAKWNPNGITVASNLHFPYDMATDSEDNTIIADTEQHRLLKYFSNATNITLVNHTKITSVFTDKFGDIYFTDAFGNKVDKLYSKEELISTVAGGNGHGSGLDQLILDGHPVIYVDRNLSLYISDTGNDRVVKYVENATSGIIVAGGHGRGPGLQQLNTPYGIYVDEINEVGAIYICDSFNRRIQKWLPDATEGVTVAFNANQLDPPLSIQLSPTSDRAIIMYISGFNREKVFKWIPHADQAEAVIAGIGGFGSGPDQLDGPRGIKFDMNWNLFIADTGNNRIQKLLFDKSSC